MPVKGPRIKDRRTAEQALRNVQRELDEGRVGIVRQENVTFNEWADTFESMMGNQIARGDRHARTLVAYRQSLGRARDVFGNLHLPKIGDAELQDFYDRLGTIRPASRLRYLRELSACFAAATRRNKKWFDDGNPVPLFIRQRGLKMPKRGKAPFEDDELTRLFAELAEVEPVYLYAARFSVETGARLGELIALDWPNVDLLNGRVRIEFQHSAGELIAPKDKEPRTIYLTPHARKALDEWVAVVGAKDAGRYSRIPSTAAGSNGASFNAGSRPPLVPRTASRGRRAPSRVPPRSRFSAQGTRASRTTSCR